MKSALALVALCCAVASASARAQVAADPTPRSVDEFGESAARVLAETGVPGAGVALVWADGVSFRRMFAEFGQPSASHRMTYESVVDDYAYVLWNAETADNVHELGTDTIVVRNVKILAQSFAAKVKPNG